MDSLGVNSQTMQTWLKEIEGYATHFLDNIKNEWVYKKPTRIPHAEENPFAQPTEFKKVLSEFHELIQHGGVNTASGRFMGYVPGGGVPTAAIADFLAALTNRFSGMFYTSPGAQKIEADVINWMLRLFDFPESAWGTLTSGGATANLLAVLAARETWPFEKWAKGSIYVSEEAHHTNERALRVAGLAHVKVNKVPVDRNFCMDVGALERIIAHDKAEGLTSWMVLANAGTTNLGSVDPLAAIGEICAHNKIWFHVDAAYGGFFQLTESGRKKLNGINMADSITLDPHKGLFQPYGCGALVVRDRKFLRNAVAQSASYLHETVSPIEISQTDYSFELTRHFRALRVWFSLKIFGDGAFAKALNEKLDLTRYALEKLEKIPGIKVVLKEPQLTALGFYAATEAKTLALHEKINARGKIYLSHSQIDGRTVIRICILSFRTHQADIDLAIEEIKAAALGL